MYTGNLRESVMPLYDFKCVVCENTFEELISITETDNPPCPECNSETERQLGLSSFRLKGGGWYVTDYKD